MDTLPFGDNFHKHLQERKDKQAWVEQERLDNPHFLLRRVEVLMSSFWVFVRAFARKISFLPLVTL